MKISDFKKFSSYFFLKKRKVVSEKEIICINFVVDDIDMPFATYYIQLKLTFYESHVLM